MHGTADCGVLEEIADDLVKLLVDAAKGICVGPACDPDTAMGPLVSGEHRDGVARWIEKGIEEGRRAGSGRARGVCAWL